MQNVDPLLGGMFRGQDGYFAVHHMNKKKWISILLGNPDLDWSIHNLLLMSYGLAATKKHWKCND